MKISVTDNAAKKLKKTLKTGEFFRVSVDAGGCFGFQYCFSVVSKTENNDISVKKNGVFILIDRVSLPFLENATLDFQEEMIGSHFVIHNPKARQSCGCKNSFSFDLKGL